MSTAALTLQSTVRLPSGAALPLLGLGSYQVRDPTECVEACLAAFRAGYRHVDTAIGYRNEEFVGQAIKHSGLRREDVFITSKITAKLQGYQETLDAVEASLARLDTSFIDLFLLHDPLAGSEKRLASYRALAEKQKEGKLIDIGVSNFGVCHLKELLASGAGPKPAVNQIEVHPRCQYRDIVEFCRLHGVTVEAYCPIGRAEFLDDPVIQRVASETGKSPAQVLLRWSLQHGFIPLPKSIHPARIVENAAVYDFALTGSQMSLLNGLDRGCEGAVSWGGAITEWKG